MANNSSPKESLAKEAAKGLASSVIEGAQKRRFARRYEVPTSHSSGKNFSSDSLVGRAVGWRPTQYKELNWIIFAIIVVVLILVGTQAYAYSQTESGQRMVADYSSKISNAVEDLNPFTFVQRAEENFGGGWGLKNNPESTLKGLVFNDFEAVSPEVFAGQPIKINYDIRLMNVEAYETAAEFNCVMTKIKTDGQTSELYLEGEIVPSPYITFERDIPQVSCNFADGLTEELDGQATVEGSISFAFETEDATLPVYIIKSNIYDKLWKDYDTWQNGFYQEYNPPLNDNELKVTYNGEPVSISIGTAPVGQIQQPVVAGAIEKTPYLGIKIKNEWNSGTVTDLTELKLTLPPYIQIDEDLSQNPNIICPFNFVSSSFTEGNIYEIDETVRENLFKLGVLGTEEKARSFECSLIIDETGLDPADYTPTEYKVDASYGYTLNSKTETISIRDINQEISDEDGGEFGSIL